MAITSSDIWWAQKHRPRKVADCILPVALKKTLQGVVDKGQVQNFFFSGTAGIGKTTAALAICDELGLSTITLNGSGDDRGIDAVKNKIPAFAMAMSMDGSRKCVIYDEADNITRDAQLALRAIIESVSKNCSLIMTGNYPGKMEDALLSRCEQIDFQIPPAEAESLQFQMFKRARQILKEEGVEFDPEAVAKIVAARFPDFRKTMNALQRAANTGRIDAESANLVSMSGFDALPALFARQSIGEINQWVAETHYTVSDVAKWIDDKGSELFADANSWAQAIVHAAQYDYQSAFVAVPKVNMKALLIKIASSCKFKAA